MESSLCNLQSPDAAYQRSALEGLREAYPFLTVRPLGSSLCGRPITLLKIGQDTDERGGVLFAGAFHGIEWLTGLVLLRFVDRLCRAISTKQTLAGIHPGRALEGRSLSVLPFVNPDGVEIALHGAEAGFPFGDLILRACNRDPRLWKANARGVDINHNFDAGWTQLREMEKKKGIDGPAPTQYGGPAPESEPETKLLTALCRQENFRHVLAYHSQGEEIYWHYGENNPQNAFLMGRILAVASGYSLSMPSGLASHGGFKDWFIDEFHRPGFTVEIGKGQNPLPLSDLDRIYKRLEEMMMLATIM